MIKLYKTHKMLSVVLCFAIGILLLQFVVLAYDKIAYPQRYSEFVEEYSAEFNVPKELIYAVIHTESGFNENAQSDASARGLMQITNETYEWIKLMIAPNEDLSFDDMFDAKTNIRFGAYFLAVALESYGGDISTAVAAYHSGMGLVGDLLQSEEYSQDGKVLHTFPYEQMDFYVYKIENAFEKYTELYD